MANPDPKTLVKQFFQIKAPFASFRPFQSGAYRSTTPVPSPSTVYGLLLNIAGIEQREELTTPVKSMRDDLPEIEIAIAQISQPETALLTQQLHHYPVGASGAELAQKTYGSKYWIAPVKREVLVNLNLVIGMKAEQWLCDRILQGLSGELDEPRYGLPFAGDNNFLFDSIESIDSPPMARWYSPLQQGNYSTERGYCRLTVWINRADNSKTEIAVFAPSSFCLHPPESAWIKLPVSNMGDRLGLNT
ncbi:type I-MYXAN CRISPR-associated protein Cas5/Cmx5/DevS [Nostoc spongiaeforme FACHB-130]|uniref:Type I-MYXAN CRISPR-associated protein Cas5/Cmx5/DevS n=1 Tax=Nostoc spongiaeforme FACHB-130 TaxID=1357510 RepID=A0ABR8G520_9NOSO|nr:type I-MYXAN CRISPR-associated protein Cas5/Cmx5/DevS [Nostoc spongiaeforme]MBD2598368.1 type I-MYXAN CRISPR-associated protein Cas5/Cmx5/DevS [Nostoc spongiaeforme FACHB-130]